MGFRSGFPTLQADQIFDSNTVGTVVHDFGCKGWKTGTSHLPRTVVLVAYCQLPQVRDCTAHCQLSQMLDVSASRGVDEGNPFRSCSNCLIG
jgi:hypothetical protein